MRRCLLDKIASVTQRLSLDRNAILGDEIPASAGTVVACRVLNSKSHYSKLEDVHGRMVEVHRGDVIAGALGHRDALYGYSGKVPEALAVGDELQMLNAGGVMGVGAEAAPGIGEPFRLEVLGSVLEFPYLGTRVGIPARIERVALPTERLETGGDLPPIVMLVGTCMDAGKTTAAAALIHHLSHAGARVGAGKLTGVSLRRDVLEMQDCGADPAYVFTDFGVITTNGENAVAAAHGLIGHLAEAEVDVMVLEMGDGLLGTYGVHELLSDDAIRAGIGAMILCAQDPVGAWGGAELLRGRYDLTPDIVTGRVTDTAAGLRYCRERLEVEAWNALAAPAELSSAARRRLDAPRAQKGALAP